MAEYLSPGIYVEEFESGSRPMEGVGTSTAGFIGLAVKGSDIGIPQLVTNFGEFRRKYGSYLSKSEFGDFRFLAYAVEHFFINGGTRAFIMRVCPPDAIKAKSISEQTLLSFEAKNPGTWGNSVRIVISPASKAKTQIFEIEENSSGKAYKVKSVIGFQPGDVVMFSDGEAVEYNKIASVSGNLLTFANEFEADVIDAELLPTKTLSTCEFTVEIKYEDTVELYENLSFNVIASNFVENKLAKSELVSVTYAASGDDEIITPFIALAGDKAVLVVGFDEGSNGSAASISASDFIGTDNGPGKRTGIQSFIDNDMVSIMAIPGVTDANVQLSLVAHCESLASRFAVLDIPQNDKKIDDVTNHRNLFDTNYAALYHPWLEVFDSLDKKNIAIPPSGSVIGIYARSDNTRGVHKAPANEVVRACVGLDCIYNKGEQDILNPKGVNLIRVFPGQGIRVWGARTATSNSLWKYVNVRRLFIFVEESIKANTNWVVFEPNDEMLWTRVKRTIDVFLNNVWRGGALAGGSPAEAFYVNVGRSTMSQDDIDNGRLICEIGIAPVKPAEFVIFRITQKTASE
ncbi:MAG: phage tail sheath family protein [Oscillospiraceae bacterium]|nr:phage tail sheath family protein [Oscillospiraceae bacterium]